MPQLGFEPTSVSRVAPTLDLLKDALPVELPCSGVIVFLVAGGLDIAVIV